MAKKTLINTMSRRSFVATSFGAVAALALVRPSRAQALQKADVQYQDEPKGDQRCDNCTFWQAESDDAEIGACTMVQGEIAAAGWCSIWAPAG